MRAMPFPGSIPVALAIAVLCVGPATAQDTPRPMTVEDVLALESIGQVAISPDGRWVAFVVTTRNFDEDRNDTDVWLAPSDPTVGAPIRLTTHEGADGSPTWHPDGWLAFASDRGEERQVFGIRPDGGEAWAVTDHPTGVNDFDFSPDGRRVGFIANPEATEEDEELGKARGEPIVWDSAYTSQWSRLYTALLADREADEAVQRSPDNLHVQGFVWGPDSRSVAFSARSSPVLRTFYHSATWVQTDSEEPARQVTFMPGGDGPVVWSETLGLVVSGSGHELGTYNGQLWRVPLIHGEPAGEPESLTTALDENAGFVAATDRELFVEVTRGTGRGLFRLALEGGTAVGEPTPITDDAHYYSGFSASEDGSTIAFLADDAGSAPQVHVSSTASFVPRSLTDVNAQVRDFQLGEQRVVRWSSRADGEPIEGVLTLPVGYAEGEPVPLVLVIHGGPSGVSSNRFSPTRGAYPIQVYAGMGFAVLQPNYRGSTGYGERFRGLNRGDISGRDWIDIDSGVDAMIEAGIADPERLAVSGWSFGGHHTYWGITQTDRYRAASAGAGANDLISMYSQTDIPEFYHTYLGPRPWEDWELYEERSAYRRVERVTTPLLIQVGERDERVPAEQSIQFYEAVKQIGKAPTKLVVYPGQPHGVRAPRLYRDLMQRNVEWLRKWVLEDSR